MATVTFRSGDTQNVDYTTGGTAVAAGDVIVFGEVPFVAPVDIPKNSKGALSVSGGVYVGVSDGTLDTPGALAYWDATTKKFTNVTLDNKHFGYTGPNQGATVDKDMIEIIHLPTRAGTTT